MTANDIATILNHVRSAYKRREKENPTVGEVLAYQVTEDVLTHLSDDTDLLAEVASEFSRSNP